MRIVFPDGAGCVRSPADLDPLRRLGEVDFYDSQPADPAELIARVRPADAIVLDYSVLDAEVLSHCDRLRFISFLGIGYASCIDVAPATARGIVIANTPDYGATSVAEHALGMMLALTRHIGAAFVSIREGRWEPGRFQGIELRGKTLGLVGLGLLAPRAHLRAAVVPRSGREGALGGGPAPHPSPPEPQEPPSSGAGRLSWAALMRRVFAIDVLLCPHCGGRRRIVAVYSGGQRRRDLLDRLGLSQPPGLPPPQGFPDLDAAT